MLSLYKNSLSHDFLTVLSTLLPLLSFSPYLLEKFVLKRPRFLINTKSNWIRMLQALPIRRRIMKLFIPALLLFVISHKAGAQCGAYPTMKRSEERRVGKECRT